ncbi:glycosyltransferase family A protein [Xenorhabdus stockiae]|uniref:glycosyltransferase family A protein n=1 Tax=Xenorhabdus stockiae TaxID=351614 RepID=UPI004064C416
MSNWFVIPHHAQSKRDNDYLIETLLSIHAQSIPDWCVVIVDDNSSFYDLLNIRIQDFFPKNVIDNRFHFIVNENEKGVSSARNLGVKYAHKQNANFILFQDDDDIAHPYRIEKTLCAAKQINQSDLIISTTFSGIDEKGNSVSLENFRSDMLDVAVQHSRYIPEGNNKYLDMIRHCGYIFPTSGTTVNVDLALRCPFPDFSVSEDHVTWMNMVAEGAFIKVLEDIPFKYRFKGDSEHRPETFLKEKYKNDIEGFIISMNSYIEKFGSYFNINEVIEEFLNRLNNCLSLQENYTLSDKHNFKASFFEIKSKIKE